MYYGNFSVASNRADWMVVCALTDDQTGDYIDISGCRITITVVKRQRNPNAYADGYYYGNIIPADVMIQGSTDTGEITIPAMGTFQWLFPAATMNGLPQGEYQIGVRCGQNDRIVQLIKGTVHIEEGIDNQ
jgi:hypothetical protein